MATYPGGIVTLATHSDTTDTIFAADINTPNAEIVAVETGLLNGFQHDLVPLTDDARSLGSTSKRWLKGWYQDIDLDGTLTQSGYAGVGAALVSNASKAVVEQVLTNGQLVVGSTGAAPVAAALTAGAGILITNAAGSITVAATNGALDKSTTEQDVTNTAVATDVYSYSVPGGTLGTNGILRLTATGDCDQASGGSINLTIAVSFGGTTIAGTAAQFTVNTGTAKAAWRLTAFINANGATNAQRAVTEVNLPAPGSSYANGQLQTSIAADLIVSVHDALALDSTAAQTLKITVTWASAAPSAHLRRWTAMTEKL